MDDAALKKRNEDQLAKAKEWLGTKWLLHPANRVERKDEQPQKAN